MTVTLHHGDCIEVMRGMADGSVDAVVTDPPYGLSFMGRHWDHGVPGAAYWTEALRLLKPGGHLLAFGGTRTCHRMACVIEDAGFEIRDRVRFECSAGTKYGPLWDSLHDEQRGAVLELLNDAAGGSELAWVYGSGFPKSHNLPGGFGTALKPSHEPIVVARKPLAGTVAENVARYGTGALNIEQCRVPTNDGPRAAWGGTNSRSDGWGMTGYDPAKTTTAGRWPANLCHDGSDEVLEAFAAFGERGGGFGVLGSDAGNTMYGGGKGLRRPSYGSVVGFGDTGTAARFFYCAKASKADRGEGNGHPTVKPQSLMRWLCRLVTPPGGLVLDPFAGSGSTLLAARAEGFRAVGIEREAEYCEIIRRRLAAAEPVQPELFGAVA